MNREKIELEFEINVSPTLLFNYISNGSNLADWFADDVNIKNNIFTFKWEGSEEKAHLIKSKQNVYTRFKWEEDLDSKYYFEFRIIEDELTGDVSLMVTDFIESGELDEVYMLWQNKIEELKHKVGC